MFYHNKECNCDICSNQKTILVKYKKSLKKIIEEVDKKMKAYPYPLLIDSQRKEYLKKYKKELLKELK